MGVAILAKGPVGMLLPIATIGLFLLIVNQPIALEPSQPSGRGRRIARWLVAAARPLAPRNVLRAVWTMRPLTAVIVVLAVALPWYVLVGLRTDGAWLEQFFARYNVGPFLKPSLGHRGPLVYHFLAIFVGLFPWAVLLVPTLLRAARQVRLRDAWRPGYILLWCWTGVFFVFWSACSTKLPHYVLPAYPALALLMGCFVHDWLTDPSRLGRLVPRHVAATLILVGLGILAAAPVVTAFFSPGEWPVGLVGLAPVLGGGLYLFYERRAQPRRMVAVLAVTAVAFLAAVFAVAAQRIDRHQHSAPLVKAIRDASPTTPQIAGYRFLQGSIVYYAGQPLPCCENAKQLHRFVARWPQPYIITTSRYEPEIERQFPGQFHVLARRPRFLRCQEDVLVLTRGDNTASPHVAGGTGTLIDTDRR
jgi:4-amino-4-deoxy-L-arabinose transferase-like glycosyltransferase